MLVQMGETQSVLALGELKYWLGKDRAMKKRGVFKKKKKKLCRSARQKEGLRQGLEQEGLKQRALPHLLLMNAEPQESKALWPEK